MGPPEVRRPAPPFRTAASLSDVQLSPFTHLRRARVAEMGVVRPDHDAGARLGAIEKTLSDRREEAALLATIQDLATFNEAMRRSGDAVRLVRSSQEGYELKRNGNVLVHIPPCSESRAAWCAYFYRKAITRETRSVDPTDR